MPKPEKIIPMLMLGIDEESGEPVMATEYDNWEKMKEQHDLAYIASRWSRELDSISTLIQTVTILKLAGVPIKVLEETEELDDIGKILGKKFSIH